MHGTGSGMNHGCVVLTSTTKVDAPNPLRDFGRRRGPLLEQVCVSLPGRQILVFACSKNGNRNFGKKECTLEAGHIYELRPHFNDGNLLILSTDIDYELIDETTGKSLWKVRVPKPVQAEDFLRELNADTLVKLLGKAKPTTRY